MNKYFTIIILSVIIFSCSSVKKHKSIEVVKKDSVAKEASKEITATILTATVKKNQVDTTASSQEEKRTVKTNTTFVFKEIPADATPTYPTDAADYFPPGYKTKDGRQFIAVPESNKEETSTTHKQENSRSVKNEEAQLAKHDTTAKETAKEVTVNTASTVTKKDVRRTVFSWWWLLLIIPAYLLWRYRKPMWAFIKKFFGIL